MCCLGEIKHLNSGNVNSLLSVNFVDCSVFCPSVVSTVITYYWWIESRKTLRIHVDVKILLCNLQSEGRWYQIIRKPMLFLDQGQNPCKRHCFVKK